MLPLFLYTLGINPLSLEIHIAVTFGTYEYYSYIKKIGLEYPVIFVVQ
jgi:hypothetical protein